MSQKCNGQNSSIMKVIVAVVASVTQCNLSVFHINLQQVLMSVLALPLFFYTL